jgi:hypothetical protein
MNTFRIWLQSEVHPLPRKQNIAYIIAYINPVNAGSQCETSLPWQDYKRSFPLVASPMWIW